MSREIDPDAIAAGTLTDEEVEYLRVRGKLPDNYMGADERDPEWEAGNAAAMTPRVKPRSMPLEEQSVPRFSDGAIDADDDELDGVGSSYSNEEGWNNDKRRAELSRRGLSVSGSKDDLIGRLKRHDSGQLEEDDYEPSEPS